MRFKEFDKTFLWIILALVLIATVIYQNYHLLQEQIISKNIDQIKKAIKNEITSKQSATLALAITASKCRRLVKFLQERTEPPPCLYKLPKEFRRYTYFKNIKIELLDPDFKVLHRTWSKKIGYKEILDIKKPYSSGFLYNDLGFFIYSKAPVKKNGTILGYLLLLSHFNSIGINLSKLGISINVIIADLEDKKRFKILDSIKKFDKDIIDQTVKLESFFEKDGNIYAKFPLIDQYRGRLGWIIFSFPKREILNRFFSEVIIKRVLFLFVLIFLMIVGIYYLYTKERAKALKQQAKYFYNILDTLQEIVIVTDGKKLRYANAKFFEYFDEFHSIEEFMHKHRCICDFFVEEDGFLMPLMDGKRWTEFLIEHEGASYRVKVKYKERIYIFQVKAKKITDDVYSVIFSDITNDYFHTLQLHKMAIKDPLTGLFNRRILESIVKEKIKNVRRYNSELLFIVLDIDHFKKINDTFGHERGDYVLKELAHIIKKYFREDDPVIRVGGEEFLVVVETKNIKKILDTLKQFKDEVQRHHFRGVDREVTVSIGVARYKEGDDLMSLYKRADEALYESKKRGRNRITYKD